MRAKVGRRNFLRCDLRASRRDGAMIGQVFNRLTVLAFERKRRGYRHWLCRCTCGAETTVREDHLRDGSTRSCGCLRRSTWAEFRQWQRAGRPV
jgi:hypothetical protein